MRQFVRLSTSNARAAAWPLGLMLCLVLALLPIACSRSKDSNAMKPAHKDKTIGVSKDDPEMQAAIAKARSTLPLFWATFDNPTKGETSFALKVRITDANGVEHFWVNRIEKKEGLIYGTINNDPNTVKSVKMGQRIEVPEEQISDWTFMRKGKMVGNYTLRPLLKSMPKDEAEKLEAIMEEP